MDRLLLSLLLLCPALLAQEPVPPRAPQAASAAPAQPGAEPSTPPTYVLGPDDQISVRALDVQEFDDKPLVIDRRGEINLPLIGRVHAGGLTGEQLEDSIANALKTYVQEPHVLVTVAGFRSQPVSVLGAVGSPGVQQVHGEKTLFEVLSMAGGVRADAGNVIKITRQKDEGPLPLPNAAYDPTGRFSVGEVRVNSIMEAKNPQENIVVKPNDVISVPQGKLVYVVGCVKRPGGFVISEKDSISILEVLALANGLDRAAGAKNTRILRPAGEGVKREEIHVDLQKILDGKLGDMPLKPNDILIVPTSAAKNAAIRSLEAAISIGTMAGTYAVYR